MPAAPISPERLEEHFRAGRVLLDGEPVESLDVLAPPRESDCARTSRRAARRGVSALHRRGHRRKPLAVLKEDQLGEAGLRDVVRGMTWLPARPHGRGDVGLRLQASGRSDYIQQIASSAPMFDEYDYVRPDGLLLRGSRTVSPSEAQQVADAFTALQ
jgi:hypothetical protein